MAIEVQRHADPRAVLTAAADLLAAEPVRHNLVATLLARCAEAEGAGRFWVASDGGTAAGIVFQWPIGFFAAVTPMPRAVVGPVVDAIVAEGVTLPGVNGEAATAAEFAGCWAERTRAAARPVEALRLYEVEHVRPPRPVPGAPRRAGDADREVLAAWTTDFAREVGEPVADDPHAVVATRIAAGELWIWDADGPSAFCGLTAPTGGAVRVGPVFTPPDRRGRGSASALVGHCSAAVLGAGHRCLLYADLANPTSNGVYVALGYRAVAETVRYEFSVDAGGGITSS